MTLYEYLGSNTLISNTYNIFNYNFLATRLKVLYGSRTIRPEIDISEAAQNYVDIYKNYLSALFQFDNEYNPMNAFEDTVIREGYDNTQNSSDTSIENESTTDTNFDGTVTNDNTNTQTSKDDNTTNTQHTLDLNDTTTSENKTTGTTTVDENKSNSGTEKVTNNSTSNDNASNFMYAYNQNSAATTGVPTQSNTNNGNTDGTSDTETTSTVGGNTRTENETSVGGSITLDKTGGETTDTTNTANSTLTNKEDKSQTEKSENSVTHNGSQTNTTKGNSERDYKETITKKGYNSVEEIEKALERYQQPYDIMCTKLVDIITLAYYPKRFRDNRYGYDGFALLYDD